MQRLKRSTSSRSSLRVLGVDPSLSSTGYAYRDPSGKVITGRVTCGDLRGCHRLYYMRSMLERVVDAYKPDIVYYENYAFGAKREQQALGELGGVYKTMLWDKGITVTLVTPSFMKSVIAMKGNAKKPEIKKALLARYGINVPQNDEADAAGLLLIGEMQCGKLPIPADIVKSKRFVGVEDKCIKTTGRLQSISKKSF